MATRAALGQSGMGAVLVGIDPLLKKFNRFENKEYKKITRKAIRAGAKIIKKRTKQTAKSMVGGAYGKVLSSFLAVRAGTSRKKETIRVFVGFKKKAKIAKKDVTRENALKYTARKSSGRVTFIPSAIEYGHDIVLNMRNQGRNMNVIVGKAKPIPFFTRAYDSSKSKARTIIMSTMRTGIIKNLKHG